MMTRVFAENAWLGPGRFARRVLVEFDSQIRTVLELREDELPPGDAERVQWLIPGLVNAHCHLEYTWLEGAGLPRGTVPFGEWMCAIMSRRPADVGDRERQLEAMREGARRLLAGGCTAVFDSTTDGASAAVLQEAGLRHFLFHEVLGLTQERAEPIWDKAIRLQRRPAAEPLMGAGLNPHAPYSVGEWLRERLRSDEAAGLPQAWHLAETPDEESMFRAGEGSIAEFFREAGLPMPWAGREVGSMETLENSESCGESGRSAQPTFSPAGACSEHRENGWASSFDFVRDVGLHERCRLVFHGNELSLEKAGFFRAPRGIVHCPGTHRWFERGAVPLRAWLDVGVNVCLGTDSLASAETLSMLDLVRMTLEDHPDLSVDEVLTMACVNPWRVDLGTDTREGLYGLGIAVGGVADLVGLGSESGSGQRAASDSEGGVNERDCGWGELLGGSGGCVVGSWVGGVFVDATFER